MEISKGLQGFLLAFFMLATGTLNTIFLKFQNYQLFLCTPGGYECEHLSNINSTIVNTCEISYDCAQFSNGNGTTYQFDLCVCNCAAAALGKECVGFEQPFFQTFTMFTGELLCLFAFYFGVFWSMRKNAPPEVESDEKGNQLTGFRKFLFVFPTLCDLTATTLMNVGLIMTSASVFQMLRGCVVVFTGVFSVIFLRRKQWAFHWVAMFFIVAGVAVVGLVSVLNSDSSSGTNPIVGDLLVVLAQVFTATQFIVEEKFLGSYNVPPLQGVGFEGVFGVCILAMLMPIVYFAIGINQAVGNQFDIRFAFEQFIASPEILVSSIGCIFSIAFFNFCGLTVTKVMSATSRTTIDAMRTLSVWIVSLLIGWEFFLWPQIIGFAVLVFGTFMYNRVFVLSFLPFLYPPEFLDQSSLKETEPLLDPASSAKKNDSSIQVHPSDADEEYSKPSGDL